MQSQYVLQYEELEKFHWWWIARREIVHSMVMQLANGSGAKKRLLDVGCGAGMQLSVMQNFEKVGLEPNQTLAKRAESNTGAPILNETLPLNPSHRETPFDFVLLLDVLEHLEEDVAGLRSVVAALKPDGYVIINVPAHPWLWTVHDEVNEHKRRYTRQKLIDTMNGAGLQIQFLKFWGSFLVPAALLRTRKPGSAQKYQVSIPGPSIAKILSGLLKVDFWINKYLPSFTGLSLLAVGRKITV